VYRTITLSIKIILKAIKYNAGTSTVPMKKNQYNTVIRVAAKYRTGQIEAQIPDIADLVVDIIAEQIQKKHIADNMYKASV